MKRSPLKRKTPLRAKHPSLTGNDLVSKGVLDSVRAFAKANSVPIVPAKKPRARLAPASGKQAARLARYHAMVDGWQGRRVCAKCGHKAGLEPHHPYGRGRENLFRVVLLCHLCHACTHEFPDLAYELGWLTPEYKGKIRPPDFPVPWQAHQLITDIPT